MNMVDFEGLIDLIDRPGVDRSPSFDIIRSAPDLSLVDALRVQLGVKSRRVAAGDAIVGYQASFTSASAQKWAPSMPPPMVGTLLRSLMRTDGDVIELDEDPTYIES
jgi:2-keto-4-pentenoate hydratase